MWLIRFVLAAENLEISDKKNLMWLQRFVLTARNIAENLEFLIKSFHVFTFHSLWWTSCCFTFIYGKNLSEL